MTKRDKNNHFDVIKRSKTCVRTKTGLYVFKAFSDNGKCAGAGESRRDGGSRENKSKMSE